jgi:hypothetical protein
MASQAQSNGSAIGCLVLLILAGAIGGFVWWVMPDKYAYSFQYDVDLDNVFVDKKPKNCDWEHAPIGDKGCHYKKVVTPQKNEKDKVKSVYVTWEKVEE